MKILISNDAPMHLTQFYETVARQMNCSVKSETNYDCRKINVAENIQDRFYEYYTALARETEPAPSENDIKIDITMLLVMSGPKVDPTLEANEVEVFDGFIC